MEKVLRFGLCMNARNTAPEKRGKKADAPGRACFKLAMKRGKKTEVKCNDR